MPSRQMSPWQKTYDVCDDLPDIDHSDDDGLVFRSICQGLLKFDLNENGQRSRDATTGLLRASCEICGTVHDLEEHKFICREVTIEVRSSCDQKKAALLEKYAEIEGSDWGNQIYNWPESERHEESPYCRVLCVHGNRPRPEAVTMLMALAERLHLLPARYASVFFSAKYWCLRVKRPGKKEYIHRG